MSFWAEFLLAAVIATVASTATAVAAGSHLRRRRGPEAAGTASRGPAADEGVDQ